MNETERAEYMAIVAALISNSNIRDSAEQIAGDAMCFWLSARDQWHLHEDAANAIGSACET